MEILKGVLAVILVLEVLTQITIVGRKRLPYTGLQVAFNTLLNGLTLWVLLN